MSSIFLAEDKALSSDEDRGELVASGCREQPQENNKTNAINTREPRCLMASLPDIIIPLSQIFQRLSSAQFSLYNSIILFMSDIFAISSLITRALLNYQWL
jgi:hypothetical protein